MSNASSTTLPDPAALVGTTGSVELTVATGDTAIALGSGDVEVLATPRVVALAEEAACAALAGSLDPQMTTVGVRVELDHIQASQVGSIVVATATVTAVEGRKVDFALSVMEEEAEVARGSHRRVIARREVFAT
ncbi:thioesterase family protein [Euzebya tangerina]|uniref:thioesterase family protein n=1 Tax=Euzebya tangerina TaxID=591198 RepID=UPI000E31DCD2|nr:hotdog domain-containing protein [Euzebya tangerina]